MANRRDFLRIFGLGAAASVLPTTKATVEPFEPDYEFDAMDIIAPYVTVYLDGVKQKRCYACRVKWESFERPTFGELVVGATRNGLEQLDSRFHIPAKDEYVRDDLLVKDVTGLVYIELEEKGRKEYEAIRQAYREAGR